MKADQAIKALTDGTPLDDPQAAHLAALTGNLLVVPLICAVPPPKPLLVVSGGSNPSAPAQKTGTSARDSDGDPATVPAITADNLVQFIAANGRIEPELAAKVLEVVLQFIAAEGARALAAFRGEPCAPD